MTKKIMSVLVPVSVALFVLDSGAIIIGIFLSLFNANIASSMFASSAYQFLGNFTPLINSLFLISVGWWMTRRITKDAEGDNLGLRQLGIAIAVAMVFIPIIFAPTMLFPYIVGKGFVFRFLALALIVVYALLTLSSTAYRPRITPPVLGLGALSIAMLLSTLLSIDPYKSFLGNYERMDGYITTISLFGVLLALVSMRLKDVEWSKIFAAHVGVSLFVSGLGVLQYIFSSSAWAAGFPILNQCIGKAACQVDSTLGNPIYLGIYAALSAWIIIYALLVKKAQSYVPLLWVAFVINILTIILSGARGATVGLFVGAIVAGVIYLYIQNRKKDLVKFAGAGVLLAVLCAGFIWTANSFGFAQSIPLVSKFASFNSLFARFEVWQVAIDAWQAKPIFGWGQENFIHAFNQLYNPAMYGQEVYFDHPHNTYLGWLAMGGALGFLAFIAFLCSFIWSVYVTYRKEQTENASLGLAISLGAFITYLVHIFFVFDNLTSILLLVFMIAYFARGVSFGSLALPQLKASTFKITSYLLLLASGAFLYFSWWLPIYANQQIIKGMGGGKGDTLVARVQSMQNNFTAAINTKSFGTYEAIEQMAAKSTALASVVPQVDEEAAKAIAEFNNIAKKNLEIQASKPYDHRAKFAYGMYLSALRDIPGAEKALTDALSVAPNKQIALTTLAQILIADNKPDQALELYKKAVAITPIPQASAGRSAYNSLRIQYIQGLMLAGKQEEAVAIIRDLIPAATRSDFQSLVSAMTDVYASQRDMRGIVNVLVQAQQLDPTNTNFIIWLARALAYAGEYEASSQQVSKLQVIDPAFVAQFQQDLQTLASSTRKQSQRVEDPVETKATTSTTTKSAAKDSKDKK